MSPLIWSPAALLDVQRAYRFLLAKNPEAARKAVKSLRRGVKVLARQPEIGRPMVDMPPEFREWLIDFGHSGYVVLYHFDGRQATILAVRHQREADF
jgi:plasmid stabilization system protein ParE